MPATPPDSAVPRRRRRRWAPVRAIAALLALTILAVFGVTIASGTAPTGLTTIDPARLTRIEPGETPRSRAAAPTASQAPIVAESIPDFAPEPRSFAPRPVPQLPQAVGVIVRPTPRPQVATGGGGSARVSGLASWYCMPGTSACHYQYSGGMYAAAGPSLRVGSWRGRTVTVCAGGSCVNVRLIDWCACPRGRVIDLYSDAFQQLAPLSSGTVRVTVSW